MIFLPSRLRWRFSEQKDLLKKQQMHLSPPYPFSVVLRQDNCCQTEERHHLRQSHVRVTSCIGHQLGTPATGRTLPESPVVLLL